MVWLAMLCNTIALTAASGSIARETTGPPVWTPPASIECAIQTAGVRDPAAMIESLDRAELRTVADVAELSNAEATELFGELRAAAVPLGDRARLRKVAQDVGRQGVGPHGQSAIMTRTCSGSGVRRTPRKKTIGQANIGLGTKV